MAVRLRAVGPDDKPVRRSTIVEAAESGDRLELLKAMRLRLARSVQDPECPPRDLAALSRRLDDVAKQIEGLEQAAAQEDREHVDLDDEAWDEAAL